MRLLLFLIVLLLSTSCVEKEPLETTKKIYDVHKQIEEVDSLRKKNNYNRPKLKRDKNYKWSDSIR